MSQPSEEEQRIKCQWCDWSTPLWISRPNGKKINGYAGLEHHAFTCHYEQWLKRTSVQDNERRDPHE